MVNCQNIQMVFAYYSVHNSISVQDYFSYIFIPYFRNHSPYKHMMFQEFCMVNDSNGLALSVGFGIRSNKFINIFEI